MIDPNVVDIISHEVERARYDSCNKGARAIAEDILSRLERLGYVVVRYTPIDAYSTKSVS